MSINSAKTNPKNNPPLVIRKKGGLEYGDPGIPDWAMKEMEKGMGLPISENTVVLQNHQENLTQEENVAQEETVLQDQLDLEKQIEDAKFKPDLKKGQFLELLALVRTEGVSNDLLLESCRIVFNKNLHEAWVYTDRKVIEKVIQNKLAS